ncbi:MAG: helix-turn-helix domain-containing protein [Anaerolineae bacterium]|nr:helix-turn-helix domain-containing protein [Burkholderiales bacterium]NIO67772.1 helix-turn-helix domain-containing protein [Anaerolineae bacterium]
MENTNNYDTNEDIVSDGLLRVREAAVFAGVSRSSIYIWMDQGLLPYVRIGRSRRIPRKALITMLADSLRQDRPAV